MAQLSNTPAKGMTVLQLEARKSFEFYLHIMDTNSNSVDLTDCVVTIVMKKTPIDANDSNDDTNLIENDIADLTEAKGGLARFSLQASDLNHKPAEYPYTVTLRLPDGYSVVIVKGVVDLLQNTEFNSSSYEYPGSNPPMGLDVHMQGKKTINVFVGSTLPPGMHWMGDEDLAKLEGLPPGGKIGEVLMKDSATDYDTSWQSADSSGLLLPANGVAAGKVPTADGNDSWFWEWPPNNDARVMGPVDLNTVQTSGFYYWPNSADVTLGNNFPIAGEVGYLQVTRYDPNTQMQVYTESSAVRRWIRLHMSMWTPWTELAQVGHSHDAANITTGVLLKDRTQRVIDLRGIARGTAAPTGGVDGDLYIQYTP